jgi:hypothetical protein
MKSALTVIIKADSVFIVGFSGVGEKGIIKYP